MSRKQGGPCPLTAGAVQRSPFLAFAAKGKIEMVAVYRGRYPQHAEARPRMQKRGAGVPAWRAAAKRVCDAPSTPCPLVARASETCFTIGSRRSRIVVLARACNTLRHHSLSSYVQPVSHSNPACWSIQDADAHPWPRGCARAGAGPRLEACCYGVA